MDRYRKHVTQRFITRREADIPTLLGKEFFVSVKVDGAFSGYYYHLHKNKSFFFNIPAHRIFLGLPVANKMKELLEKEGIEEVLLVGELHASFQDPIDYEQRSTIHDLMRIRRNPQSNSDLEKIGFKIFDILQLNGENWVEKSFPKRFEKMVELFPQSGQASLVKTKVTKNVYEIQELYHHYVLEEGHEGLIVRVGNIGYKIKPIHILDVALIGVANGREDTELKSDQIASCLVALRYPDGTYQILTRVGGGLTEDERTWLWSKIEIVKSNGFSYPTNDQRIYSMVKPKIVGQIEYFDIYTDHNGEPILEPSLSYDELTNSWEFIRMMPFVHLRSPHFIEGYPFRDDKTAQTIEDVRIRQVLDLISLSQLYPKYVIYFLDYSANRKDVLHRNVKVTNDESQMRKIYDKWMHDEMIGTTGKLKRDWKQISQ
ncbi:MAG: hypothetical protein P8Y23_09370 [Candidatus Lokiarchaeota archaeon]